MAARCRSAQNGILLWREEFAPLGVAAGDLEWLGNCWIRSDKTGQPHTAHHEGAPCDHLTHPPDAKPHRYLIRFHAMYCYGNSEASTETHLFVKACEARR